MNVFRNQQAVSGDAECSHSLEPDDQGESEHEEDDGEGAESMDAYGEAGVEEDQEDEDEEDQEDEDEDQEAEEEDDDVKVEAKTTLKQGGLKKQKFTPGNRSVLGLPSARYMKDMGPGKNKVPEVWLKNSTHARKYMTFLYEDILKASSKFFFEDFWQNSEFFFPPNKY
jgi:hypothetical protein